jgi:hypothetical protein
LIWLKKIFGTDYPRIHSELDDAYNLFPSSKNKCAGGELSGSESLAAAGSNVVQAVAT